MAGLIGIVFGRGYCVICDLVVIFISWLKELETTYLLMSNPQTYAIRYRIPEIPLVVEIPGLFEEQITSQRTGGDTSTFAEKPCYRWFIVQIYLHPTALPSSKHKVPGTWHPIDGAQSEVAEKPVHDWSCENPSDQHPGASRQEEYDEESPDTKVGQVTSWLLIGIPVNDLRRSERHDKRNQVNRCSRSKHPEKVADLKALVGVWNRTPSERQEEKPWNKDDPENQHRFVSSR